MIKAIVFDWGGVLIDSPTPYMLRFLSEQLNIPVEQLRKTLIKYKDSFQKGLVTETEFWHKIKNDLPITIEKKFSLWKKGFITSYHEKTEMFHLAQKLKDQGFIIGFLSNTEEPATQYFLERHYTVFDEILFSCKEGCIKPQKEIYTILINRLGLQPHQILFIDDKKDNIVGAQKEGIQGILFVTYEQLKSSLEKDFHIAIHD
ncbi:MAG: HAD family phosphatase [Candidatus Thermoplasmatota archaeon]|nr:HAD family phosphatase [Candidatus Thermoplasmatota archaeon]MBU1940388.1 HAD family phosphatase [Candidatus Thermoplasmatota archaeon]